MFVRRPLVLLSRSSAFRVSECVPIQKQKTKTLLLKVEWFYISMLYSVWLGSNLCLTRQKIDTKKSFWVYGQGCIHRAVFSLSLLLRPWLCLLAFLRVTCWSWRLLPQRNHQLSGGFNTMVKSSAKELLTTESSAATIVDKAPCYLRTFDLNQAFRSQSAMHFNNINTQTVSWLPPHHPNALLSHSLSF